MYLKRLECKGFKSFADKVSIKLEPGISAIVGPNGSGKSNICDAILWVLGERNAKQLRGAVMEDVIFAGSSKRSAVSVAEVSLVLDNSDGTLPIEYNEVSVSRRLYRSGESEYLINGVVSRRLDVLDILHDSGIGTDTNSIISQGHLDSILQSKPMDRRTLIEEAAGVLKHKQRKMRSQRKLERMELNLERIGDVMAEIERQLKPLRIKAKRAAAYDGLVEELSKLTLEISVDDLKKIKAKWDKVEKEKNTLTESVNNKKLDYQKKEEELRVLREKIASQNSDVVEYSAKQRSLNSAIDKLSAQSMLFSERSKSSKEKLETLRGSASNSVEANSTRQSILNEIEDLERKYNVLQNEASELRGQTETAKKVSDNAETQLKNTQEELDNKTLEQKNIQQKIEENNKTINEVSEEVVAAQSEMSILKSKIEEQKQSLEKLKLEIKDCEKNKNEKEKELERTNRIFEKNQNEINDYTIKATKELDTLEQLNNELNEVNTNILALEKFLQTSYDESSDATKWLNENKSKFNKVNSLSDIVDIPDKYLNLVEALLGNFSSSFVINGSEVEKVRKELIEASEANGSVRVVDDVKNSYIEESLKNASKIAQSYNGTLLSSEINIADADVLGAIANVVVFEDSSQVFKAAKNNEGACLASLDGTIIYPDGRYVVGSPFYVDSAYDSDSSRSILTYKKNLKKLNKNATSLSKQVDKVQLSADKIDEKIRNLREEEIEIKNNLATNKAEFDFSLKYFEEKQIGMKNAKLQLQKLEDEYDKMKSSFAENTPDIDKLREEVNALSDRQKNIDTQIMSISKQLDEDRLLYDQKKQEFNDLVVKEATLSERLNAQKANLDTAKERLKAQEELDEANLEEIKTTEALSKILFEMSDLFARLSTLAKRDLKSLDDNFSSINQEVVDIKKESDNAINAANEARKSFDQENEKLNTTQVELGRLEVQVQNAVDAIDQIDGISVDKALEMPDIENREEKEEQAFKLRRRIANMGVINPDAKQEYEVLKERYDFLNNQVEDLNAAKLSLSKIDKIIDERMRHDFIDTFNEVNEYFQKIFAVLFPGGKARLELEFPNDIENSGVEVKAQPHGKSISKMSLLSGGEKSLVALCLLFAVYEKRSTPFYILDEVEAALDDTNLRRLLKYLDNLRDTTQLIMITHQRRTMEMADILYGVSMKNDGITRVVSQRLDSDNKLHDIDK